MKYAKIMSSRVMADEMVNDLRRSQGYIIDRIGEKLLYPQDSPPF